MGDYTTLQSFAYTELFPWRWNVHYDRENDPSGKQNLPPTCPSKQQKLGSFALINVVAFLATTLLGRRTVVHRLTCRKWGKPGSPYWALTAFLPAVLNIAGNYINAAIIRATPVLGNFHWRSAVIVELSSKNHVDRCTTSPEREGREYVHHIRRIGALSEVVLQGVGAVYLGRTVIYAAHNGY
jgi:hypothetical protein